MLGDFITDLTHEIKYEYRVDDELKTVKFKVKGLSIKGMANIFNHPEHGAILYKMIDGIDLNSDSKDDIQKTAQSLIDTNYASLVYHFVASCIYIDRNGTYVSCEDEYELIEDFPFGLTVKLLNKALELTLPEKEIEVKKEVKKLIALLTDKK